METNYYEGIYSAIFSVYDEDMHVKKEAVRKLVDYQLENGINGFYVGGNTGECSVLPASTRKEMLETVVEVNRGRGRIMAHIGATHFDQAKELVEHANNQEIDAVASLPPALSKYYLTDEIVEYYKWLAKASKYPVYAYITPVLNGDPVAFADKLAAIDNIQGIKLTIPDYYAFGQIMAKYKGKLNVLNGPDETMICGLAVGVDGAIGTTYNILPKLAVSIYDSFMAGDICGAREKQNKLNAMIKIGMKYGNIAYWKAMLTLLGFDMGYTVFPRKMPQADDLKILKAELEEIGFFDLV